MVGKLNFTKCLFVKNTKKKTETELYNSIICDKGHYNGDRIAETVDIYKRNRLQLKAFNDFPHILSTCNILTETYLGLKLSQF